MGKMFENFEKKCNIQFAPVENQVARYRTEDGDFVFLRKRYRAEDLAMMSITHFDELKEFCSLIKKERTIQWTHRNGNASASKIELLHLIMRYFGYKPTSSNNMVISEIANYYFEINKNGARLIIASKDVSIAKRKLLACAPDEGK